MIGCGEGECMLLADFFCEVNSKGDRADFVGRGRAEISDPFRTGISLPIVRQGRMLDWYNLLTDLFCKLVTHGSSGNRVGSVEGVEYRKASCAWLAWPLGLATIGATCLIERVASLEGDICAFGSEWVTSSR